MRINDGIEGKPRTIKTMAVAQSDTTGKVVLWFDFADGEQDVIIDAHSAIMLGEHIHDAVAEIKRLQAEGKPNGH